MSCGPREENWTVPHVADFQGHWQKVRRKRDNSGLASVQCGKGQLAGGVWVIVAFVTVVVVTVFVFIVVFVIVVTVALAMELVSTALIAIPTEVYSLHYLALSTRCLSKNAELHARQLALIRPVLPDALLVNALGWPIRSPEQCSLRIYVRSSKSCEADRLRCSWASHSSTRLPLQARHCTWREEGATPKPRQRGWREEGNFLYTSRKCGCVWMTDWANSK